MDVIHPDWPAPPGVRALVTERRFGDMAQGGPGRAAIRAHVPAEPAWLRQVHGTSVIDASAVNEGEGVAADAAIARGSNTVCAVTVADCMPVLFCDADGTAVGIAHAGWRGLSAGVIEATFERLNVPGERTLAWLGPSIGPRLYEVGDEVRAAFVARNAAAAAAFVPKRPGHWLLDLYAVARQRLHACGVTRVFGGGFCTYSESERFFSYRRDRGTERMAALIWMAQKPGKRRIAPP